MPRSIPYLHRRGNTFSFRIAVPADVRQFLLCRELTKTLDTGDLRIAVPRCLTLAAKAKHLFYTLRQMTKEKKSQKGSIQYDYKFELSFDDLGRPKNLKGSIQYDYKFELSFDDLGRPKNLIVDAEPHEQDAVIATINAALKSSVPQFASQSAMAATDRDAIDLGLQRPKRSQIDMGMVKRWRDLKQTDGE